MFGPSSTVRIEKEKKAVAVVLINGKDHLGHMFVKKFQRVQDLLNDDRHFVPFLRDDGEFLMLNKRHLVTVKALDKETDVREPGT